MRIPLLFKLSLNVQSFVKILIFLFTSIALSQPSISVDYLGIEKARGLNFLGKDILDNSYWLTGNVVRKANGTNISSFQEFNLGRVYSVDLTNPVQLGLFYKDYNFWVILDENLVLVNQFDFSELLPTYEVSFVANSSKNTFWIIDELGKTINRYDPKSNRVNKLYTLIGEDVRNYYSDVNHLYWVTLDYKLMGIDIYGNNVLNISVPEHDLFQVLNLKSALYSYENELFYLDFEKDSISRINVNGKSISRFFFNTQKLSIFANRILSNYQLKLS